MVESLVPNQVVVGSSPIARSILFSPSRVLFFISILLTVPSIPVSAFETNPAGPEKVHLGALELFFDDLPQEISPVNTLGPEFSLERLPRLVSGWASGRPGTSIPAYLSIPPAIYYEGMAYPLDPAFLSTWLPRTGSVLLADTPVQAFLGPARGKNAFLLQRPRFGEDHGNLSVVTGNAGDSRIFLDGQNETFAAEGAFNHGGTEAEGFTDGWVINGDARWGGSGPIRGENGLLAAQWLGHDGWVAAFSRIKVDLANFQEIDWKPYFQKAIQDGIGVQEFGNEIDYHLNFAGLAECQLAGGWSRSEPQGTGAGPAKERTFIQNTDLVDVLGMANLIFAFREDIPSDADPIPNFLIGLKGKLTDEWTVLGDLQTAAWASGVNDRVGEMGLENYLDPKLWVGYGFLHQEVGGKDWNGGRLDIRSNRWDVPFFYNRPISVEISGRGLWEETGSFLWDWGGKFLWEFLPGWSGWVGGRKTTDQPWWAEVGVNIPWDGHFRSMITVSNLNGLYGRTDGLYGPQGVGVFAGLDGEF